MSTNERRYQTAVKEMAKVIKTYNKRCLFSEDRLSGYTAHTKLGQYGGIKVNGKGDLAHEDFILREHFNQNEDFEFCKTARKPYDLVVVACLIILQSHLKGSVVVSSDGSESDWTDGQKLAESVVKRKLDIPKGIRR